MKIGCHISVSKGFLQAAKNAEALGASAFQVFTKSPRSLKPKKLDLKDAARGREYCQEREMLVITHTPYITNLSTPDAGLQEATIRSLREDLYISSAYGAVGAVVHCGKHVGKGESWGIQRMVDTINYILDDTPPASLAEEAEPLADDFRSLLLLENTAGQGSELGHDLETLVHIYERVERKDRLGFCFDTCHGFAAGLWKEDEVEHFFQTAKDTGYLEVLAAIHLNDSKMPYQSRKDRHEKLGKGEIGAKGLLEFLRRSEIQHLPIVLETPVEDESEYAEEIVWVKQNLASA